MAKSAEQISPFLNLAVSEAEAPLCVPEELAPEPKELSFGLYLRRQRILRGISRDEVIRVTKVSPEYLDALESNQFEGLPPKTFVLGLLRVISEYAGLDENDVITRYLAELSKQDESPEEFPVVIPTPFWKKHLAKILGAVGFLCLVVLMFAPLLKQ